jgi:hypothetical protein
VGETTRSIDIEGAGVAAVAFATSIAAATITTAPMASKNLYAPRRIEHLPS